MVAPNRAAITVSTVTLKHSKPHYQPDSHAARLSHSERAITQPDAETQPETKWNEQAQTVQLLPDTHTLMQRLEKVDCCCLLLLNFAIRGGFQCTCSERSVLESFKADNSNYTDKLCLTYSAVTICCLLSHNQSRRKETNIMYEVFAQNELTPFKCSTKTSYFKGQKFFFFFFHNLKYIE